MGWKVGRIGDGKKGMVYNNILEMGLFCWLGVSFTAPGELFLILLQFLCFTNSYYVTVVLLGPLPLPLILLITLLYSRALLALHLANSTHTPTLRGEEGSRFCRKCGEYIAGRDHHCIFTGRCVQRANYGYFVSYVLYAYLLSCHTLFSLANHYPLLYALFSLPAKVAIPLGAGFISSLYFLIFTGGLLASSFRSVFLGIYTVEELKKEKEAGYENGEIRRMWFSREGRRKIVSEFKKNWGWMVAEEATVWRIILVY